MARRNCKHPDACVAGSRGPCRKCSDLSANAERAAERMRKLNADKRGFTIPDHLRDSYNLARRKGFSPREAIKIAEVS